MVSPRASSLPRCSQLVHRRVKGDHDQTSKRRRGRRRDRGIPFSQTPSPCFDPAHVGPQDPSSHTDPGPVPLRRTTTGIISNRRPIDGTPASTSGNTTPSLNTDVTSIGAARGLSLLATAKREAAKRGLYARFFRGPVLGPDSDPHSGTTSHLDPSSSESSPVSTSVPEHVGDQEDVGETKKSKKRKAEDRVETKKERKERRRLKKARKAARAAKRAEKALAAGLARKTKDRRARKARKHQDGETEAEENQTLKKERARKSPVAGSMGDELEQVNCTRRGSEEELASTNDGQQDALHRLPSNVVATDVCNFVLKTKKKKGKRKDTPS